MEYVEQVRSLNVDENKIQVKKKWGEKKKKTKQNEIYKEHFLIDKNNKKKTMFKEIQSSVKFETRKDNLIISERKNRRRGK